MNPKDEKLVRELRELTKDVPTEKLIHLMNCFVIPANMLILIEYQKGEVKKELE